MEEVRFVDVPLGWILNPQLNSHASDLEAERMNGNVPSDGKVMKAKTVPKSRLICQATY
jgi:hypothetical protein